MANFFFLIAHMQDFVAIVAPIALVVLVLSKLNQLSLPRIVPLELIILAVLIFYLIFNIIINNSLEGIGLINFVKSYGKIFYTLALFLIFFSIRPTLRLEHSFYPVAIYAGFIVSIILLISYISIPIHILGIKTISRSGTISGTLGGHGPMAACLGQIMIIYLVSIIYSNEENVLTPIKANLFNMFMITTIFIIFTLTMSRGRTLALFTVISLMMLSIFWKSIRKFKITKKLILFSMFFCFAVISSTIILSPRLTNMEKDPNVTARFLLWLRAAEMFSKSPLTGLGIGTFQSTNIVTEEIFPGLVSVKKSGNYLEKTIGHSTEGGLHAHNTYLQLLAEVGLVGTGLFFLFLLMGSLRALPDRSKMPSTFNRDYNNVYAAARFNKILVLYILVFLAVSGLTAGYTFVSPTTAWILYVSLARFVRQDMYLKNMQHIQYE